MIAADSSTFIAYFAGDRGRDVELLSENVATASLVLPPVVLVELLSDADLPTQHRVALLALPLIELGADYWARAGAARAALLSRKLRARLADALIAQACIDHDVALITRDSDFRHFARHCGLRLA